MKTEKNILIAFILNLAFSIFEFIGGIFTGSVAVLSDSVHDMGDAASIGISFILEKKSKKQPDSIFTYGYSRYSVLGSVITTFILLFGSAVVIYNAAMRIIEPAEINYNGMIIFAVAGVTVNSFAAFFTRDGSSLNQKAVNLHMLEDVLGWAVVLIGAIVMRFTDFSLIDPIISIGVSLFIFVNAIGNLKEILDLFLEKVPDGIDVDKIREHIAKIDGVKDVHHIHIRSIDGNTHHATMHIVTDLTGYQIKTDIRKELRALGIAHATLELEAKNENCSDKQCHTELSKSHGHSHPHHHHRLRHEHRH